MLFEGRALEWMAGGGVAVVDINYKYKCDVFVWLCCACDVVHACAMAMCLWLFVLLVQRAARVSYRIVSYLCTYNMSLCVFFCVDTIS